MPKRTLSAVFLMTVKSHVSTPLICRHTKLPFERWSQAGGIVGVMDVPKSIDHNRNVTSEWRSWPVGGQPYSSETARSAPPRAFCPFVADESHSPSCFKSIR